jgi:hypothetical protein
MSPDVHEHDEVDQMSNNSKDHGWRAEGGAIIDCHGAMISTFDKQRDASNVTIVYLLVMLGMSNTLAFVLRDVNRKR